MASAVLASFKAWLPLASRREAAERLECNMERRSCWLALAWASFFVAVVGAWSDVVASVAWVASAVVGEGVVKMSIPDVYSVTAPMWLRTEKQALPAMSEEVAWSMLGKLTQEEKNRTTWSCLQQSSSGVPCRWWKFRDRP